MSLGDFRENLADIAGVRSDKAHADELTRTNSIRQNDEKLGLASGSLESIARYAKNLERHNDGIRARGQQKKDGTWDVVLLSMLDDLREIEDQMRQSAETLGRLQALRDGLASGDITIEEALNTEEGREAIRRWEERTGRKFDSTDEDALAIFLQAIKDYETEEAARFAGLRASHDAIVERVAEIDPTAADAAREEMERLTANRAADAYAGERGTDDTALDEVARGNRDHHREAAVTEANAAEAETAFDGLLGGLDGIDGVALTSFADAAGPKDEKDQVAADPSKTITPPDAPSTDVS